MWTSILMGAWQAEVRKLRDLSLWVLSHFLKEKMGDLKALSSHFYKPRNRIHANKQSAIIQKPFLFLGQNQNAPAFQL